MVGEPCQRVVRMAEHIGAGASSILNPVDHGATDDIKQIGSCGSRHRGSEHAAGGEEIVRHQSRRTDGLPVGIAVIDDLDGGQICLDRLRDGLRRERRPRWLKIMRKPHGDLAFDADTDEILGRQRHAAGMNASCKYAAAARVRNSEIVLHHRAGAADLVTDQRAEIGRQQLMQPILNAVSAGLVLRRDIDGERLQRRAVAAGRGDGFCGRENLVHDDSFAEMPRQGNRLRHRCAASPAPGTIALDRVVRTEPMI
jgi:hypothetical protein